MKPNNNVISVFDPEIREIEEEIVISSQRRVLSLQENIPMFQL